MRKGKATPSDRADKQIKSAVAPRRVTKGIVQGSVTPASELIDQRIRELGGWRGDALALIRRLIQEAEPRVLEEWKWNNPVWSYAGIICTGEAYTKVVKLTFARGAELPDPSGLFNSSLTGKKRRAIDIREGEPISAREFQLLVRAAVACNVAASPSATSGVVEDAAIPSVSNAQPVRLLSGGNPQIAKGDGDGPVQAYIAAMPGWKSELGRKLNAIIEKAVPNLRKGVRWNSPFYGTEGQGWFVSFHVLTRYVKVTFFQGMSLNPIPPGGTAKSGEARWIDIYEDDVLDEALMESWIKQAAALPGWIP